ncbi:MAG TPA: sugar phosphate nucleotidyltransferase [candidate division Zixibacteria bacterium]|nr:sugar phosphate nucleotidyltransferase [candidate division Zixibacteria bacterium]
MKQILGNTVAVILAGGKGKRMNSQLPKVLHKIAGKPLISHVISTAKSLGIKRIIVVIGYKGELVKKALAKDKLEIVWQKKQLGTGHALMQTQNLLKNFSGRILVLCGDVPFLSANSIIHLLKEHKNKKAQAAVLTTDVADPSGYGRIIRNKQNLVEKIVEEKEASSQEKKIKEINTGTFSFEAKGFFNSLKQIKADNKSKEYYLTDVVKLLNQKGKKVAAVKSLNKWEALGINSSAQLKELEKIWTNKLKNQTYKK